MKTYTLPLFLGSFSIALLVGCGDGKPQVDNAAADAARQQLEDTRAAYEKQAADIEARSSRLAQDLSALQQSIRDKESAELNAKFEAMQQENEKLQGEAEAARQRSDELRDQLAAMPVSGGNLAPLGGVENDAAWADTEADYSTFYEELSPQGRWLDVEGYGYAWRPTVADRTGWQPYVDGRWAWSDQGWAWDSNESFGWACYHYGRWARIARHGWVWVPGREWAPAWVAWRTGDDCVGWAPLPPERNRRRFTRIGHDCDTSYDLSPSSYIFIRADNFGRTSYLNVCLSTSIVTGLFPGTVNVTNIVQVNYHQTNICVHRGGPGRDWLERRLGAPVPRAEVQVARRLDRSQIRRPSERGRDGTLQLAAAPIPSVTPGRLVAPRSAGRVGRAERVDAWEGVPADRRKGLREQVVRQAREPQPVAADVNANIPVTPPRKVEAPTEQPDRSQRPVPGRVVGTGEHANEPHAGLPEAPQGGLIPNTDPRRPRGGDGDGARGGQVEVAADGAEGAPSRTMPAVDPRPQRGGAGDGMQGREAEVARQEAGSERARLIEEQRLLGQMQAEGQRRQREAAASAERQELQRQQQQEMAEQRQQEALEAARQKNETMQREKEAATERAASAQQQARENMQRQQQAREAQREALAAQRQQEQANAAAMRAQQERENATAMRQQQQENALRQQQEAQEAARQNAEMRQQQEQQQREAAQQAAAQESARRSEDANRRAAQDAERRGQEDPQRRENNPRRGR